MGIEKWIKLLIIDGEQNAGNLIMATVEEASGWERECFRERLPNVIPGFSYRVHPDTIRFTKYNKGDIVIIVNDDLNRRDIARYYSKWFSLEEKLFM